MYSLNGILCFDRDEAVIVSLVVHRRSSIIANPALPSSRSRFGALPVDRSYTLMLALIYQLAIFIAKHA